MACLFGSFDIFLLRLELAFLHFIDTVTFLHFTDGQGTGDGGGQNNQHQSPYKQLLGNDQKNIESHHFFMKQQVCQRI